MQRISVVAGILIDKNKRLLLSQRQNFKTFPHQWEFPGGKVVVGESPEMALIRELKEELNVDAKQLKFFLKIEHDYDQLKVLIDFFLVNSWKGRLIANEGQVLDWFKLDQVRQVDLLEADILVIQKLRNII
ncbi:MAG: (deoxy)nucleoside triphosphate pyrophosphohydrolase [Pseudomonadota bacterium]|nr:(deoxy)nucleoside triphosphate pyrophosphohydrolase [Pseudomonadota bacterium]